MHVSLCSAHGQFYLHVYLYLYLYNDSELLCSSPDRTLTVLIQASVFLALRKSASTYQPVLCASGIQRQLATATINSHLQHGTNTRVISLYVWFEHMTCK